MKIHMLIFCALCTYHWQPGGSTRSKRTINMFENLIKSMRLVLNTPTEESSIKYVSPPVRIISNTPPKRIIYIKRYPMPNTKRVKPYPRRLSNKKTIPHRMKLPIQNSKQPVPWSLNPLPPPVPTSKATDPADDPPIPWNLHALPPPMATKQSKIDRPPVKKKTRTKKKLAEQQSSSKEEPKQRKEKQSKTSSQFVASPLQSEISVQPAIEIASYSETLSSQESNSVSTKPTGLHRIPRDLSHANRPTFNSKTLTEKSSNTPSKLTTSSTSWSVSQKGGIPRHFNVTTETLEARNPLPMVDKYPSTEPMPFSTANSSTPVFQPDFLTGLDFGEYADNVEADKELLSAASRPQLIFGAHPSTSVSIVKSPDVLNYHEMSPSYQPKLVEITPKPFCVTGYPHTAHMHQETKIQEKYDGEKQSTNNADAFENKPFSYRDELFPTHQPFKFGGESRSFNRPKDSILDPNFGRTRSRTNPNRWSNSKSKVSFSRNNDENKWNSGSLFADNMRSFGGNDKIEFFEPIVIDIEKDDNKIFNFESAFNFKRKTKPKRLFNEPLKLPDSLHETMNFLQKSVMRSPPPIFDIE